VLVRWERERGSNASQSPPVTPRKWVTPEAGGPTLWEGAVEGGIRDWGEVVRKLRPPSVTVGEKLGYLLETPSIRCYSSFFGLKCAHSAYSGPKKGSDNAFGADNQQGSRSSELSSGGLTPQRLHAELLETSAERLVSSLQTVSKQDEDIVRAPWRHGDLHEQGSRTGRCGWITSFLRSHFDS
jgi:hypothetical protein